MNAEPTPVSASAKPTRREYTEGVLIFLALLSAFVALGLLLWQGIGVILLIFAGLLVAVLIRTLASLLTRYTSISESSAVSIVLLVFGTIIGLTVWLTLPSIYSTLGSHSLFNG